MISKKEFYMLENNMENDSLQLYEKKIRDNSREQRKKYLLEYKSLKKEFIPIYLRKESMILFAVIFMGTIVSVLTNVVGKNIYSNSEENVNLIQENVVTQDMENKQKETDESIEEISNEIDRNNQTADLGEKQIQINDKTNNVYVVGEVIYYSGNVQYESSYSSGQEKYCVNGKAKITQINEEASHPYHLIGIEDESIHGWVDEEFITK